MPIYFANQSVIDLNTTRLMGVSVKETRNPIGYFGTGLKIAIATLLRTGHRVELYRSGELIPFTTRPIAVRNEMFDCVYMGEEQLSFTTQLGKNWEVWMAYRELHSNALDEDGAISDSPLDGGTVFVITGAAIENAYRERDKIFITTQPIEAIGNSLEIHPGPSSYIYYRGVRVGVVPAGGDTAFRYNIISQMKLTEDRTLASLWDMEWCLATSLPATKKAEIADKLLASPKTYDGNLSFDLCSSPSDVFLDCAQRRLNDANTNDAAKRLVRAKRREVIEYPSCYLSVQEQSLLNEAIIATDAMLGSDLARRLVIVTESLGPNIYAMYLPDKGKIILSRQCLDNGFNFLCATLYEEWVHAAHGHKDHTRAMQQFLFDRLIAIAMRNY